MGRCVGMTEKGRRPKLPLAGLVRLTAVLLSPVFTKFTFRKNVSFIG